MPEVVGQAVAAVRLCRAWLRVVTVIIVVVGGWVAVAAGADGTFELRVMSYNVFLGGGGLGRSLSSSVEVIEAGGADIVGIQEREGSADALAARLRFHYVTLPANAGTAYRASTAILSRYPITETLNHGARIRIEPGIEVFVFNVHLSGFPYQPYDIRDGLITSEGQAIAEAMSARGSEIAAVVSEIGAAVPYGVPVFLVGDFNEPSHLDWTQRAADDGRHFGMKVDWPASQAAAGLGLADAYRMVHGDELSISGNTWTPAPGAFGPAEKEVHDRIDFVYFGGAGVSVLDAGVVGESTATADVVVAPYPSDHRAVVAMFRLMGRRDPTRLTHPE